VSIGLLDSNFTHRHPAFAPAIESTTVLTDSWLQAHVECDHRIAWLVEPAVIRPDLYAWIREHYAEFDLVCGSDFSLSSLPNFRYVPFGGCWIEPWERGLHDKTADFSIIASPKCNTVGQKMRHEAADRFPVLERFGRGAVVGRLGEKAAWLAPYRYSVVIENSRVNGYFTEKLLDCLACGCVPLYWGDPLVGDTFESVVPFDTLDDLGALLENPPAIDTDALKRDLLRVAFYADPLENLRRVIA
jgi:hypothetical protein